MKLPIKKTLMKFYSFNPEFQIKNHLQIDNRALDHSTNVLVQLTSMKLVSLKSNKQEFFGKQFGNHSLLENLRR